MVSSRKGSEVEARSRLAVLICALLVGTAVASGQNEPERAGGIVAIVGGDMVITQTDLDRAYKRYSVSDVPQPVLDWHRLRRQKAVLDRVIDEKLILRRVQILEKKDGKPYITEQHIDAELRKRVNRLKEEGSTAHSVEDVYRAFYDRLGLNRRETRAYLRDQMRIEKYLWREVYPKRVEPWVSPEETRYYYRANIDEFTTPVTISLRHVFIPGTRRDFQLAVEGMVQGLKEGMDFADLARLYSQEVYDGMADQAGRLRTYNFEELASWHPPLPDKLKKMKPGEVSGPIISQIGSIHFFKVEDVVSGAPEPFSQAHSKIQAKLLASRREVAERKFLKEERRKTRVEILLPSLPETPKPSGSEGQGGLGGEIPEARAAEKRK